MRTVLAAAVTSALAVFPTTSHAGPCRSLDLSTGPLAVGYPDPLWTVVKPGQAAPLPIPASSVNRASGWLVPIAPSKWISSTGHGNGTMPASSPVGQYVYEAPVPIPPNTTYAAIHGDFAVDNDVTIEVGTTVVGGFAAPPGGDSQAWAFYHPLFVPDGTLTPGEVEVLRARVVNRGSREGFTFRGWLYWCE